MTTGMRGEKAPKCMPEIESVEREARRPGKVVLERVREASLAAVLRALFMVLYYRNASTNVKRFGAKACEFLIPVGVTLGRILKSASHQEL